MTQGICGFLCLMGGGNCGEDAGCMTSTGPGFK